MDGAVEGAVRDDEESARRAEERCEDRREEEEGIERRGRAWTDGMRLAGECGTVLEPVLPENGRVRYPEQARCSEGGQRRRYRGLGVGVGAWGGT